MAMLCCVGGSGSASSPSSSSAAAAHAMERTGERDFDFANGTWKMRAAGRDSSSSRSVRPLQEERIVVTRTFWNGRANVEEIVPTRTTQAAELTVRLYNPRSQEWALYSANSESAVLSKPMVGKFANRVGEFFAQRLAEGRWRFVRHVYSHITRSSYELAEATSDDGGATWVSNWTAMFTRQEDRPPSRSGLGVERSSDFDFNIGTFATHVSRLDRPLSGSSTWLEYDGTSRVRGVWDGRASLFELDVEGPAGHIEGAGLRMYDRQAHQWNLNWANSEDGVMTQPMIGEFKNGRGDFFDQETFAGRTIFARNRFVDITRQSARFEQDFSNDSGRTWETNWVMTFKRTNDARENRP